ncbi:hypothetical protein H0H92_008109 [Tricholoma furcatifolium]|nr:hypothetical protein H0H92_008109 [Tricholoma furcatifolium]
MGSMPLIVAQYDLQGHPRRTEHWSLVALSDAQNGYEFELSGNWNNFQYKAGRITCFGRTPALRGGCHVGSVPPGRIEWLRERLRDVEVVYNDVNFDCQDWVLGALRMLQADGMGIRLTSEVNIRRELAVERVRQNPGNNLHVSGLSNKVDTRSLESAFAKIGRVKKASVMYDPHTRESRGFGFVTMESSEEADAAITALNATELMGKTMTVEKARRGRARTPTPGRYYGPPKRHDCTSRPLPSSF